MLSNRRLSLQLMTIIVVVIVGFGENTPCTPNKLILLSNCSFRYFPIHNYSLHLSSTNTTTDDNRTLSIIVPYSLHRNDDDNDFLVTVITHKKSSKPLIRFNLNMIQCTNKHPSLNWTSLESSSTLRGEFLRTSSIEKNIMYFTAGKTYLKNLTAIDCSMQTMYRTDPKQLFELDLRIESTLNDYCSNENECYPEENYQCDHIEHRCACRQPFEAYSIKERYPICIQAVDTIDQCTMTNQRCLQWCHQNKSSTMCICPKEFSTKKISYRDNRAYCESRTGGICNSLIQCPLENRCMHGICQNVHNEFYQSISMNIISISIIVSCLIVFMISAILGIGIYILRHQRWKKHYHSPITSVCAKQQQRQMTVPTISDYDNITYGAFRTNIQLSSSDDNDSSPMTTSDDCSYEPKIVYLGGEQQLTAIFA